MLCRNQTLTPADLQLFDINNLPSSDDSAENGNFPLRQRTHRQYPGVKEAGGVQKHAADLLGISRRAIHYKIKKYDIDVPSICKRLRKKLKFFAV
ncbi:MAG: helix-turn-helix domain-containing protein [Desulfobacterales bacterium]